jgi:hypothetical protein
VPTNSNPAFTDGGLVLSATAKTAGLGNFDVVVNMTAVADATATCTNPAGATKPPGQNPAPVTTAGSQIIPAGSIKNGTVTFNVTTLPPVTPIPGAPGCPNSQWTEDITDLSFTTATITVSQNDLVELTVACAFDPATANGDVPNRTVSCSSQ